MTGTSTTRPLGKPLSQPAALGMFLLGAALATAIWLYLTPEPWWLLPLLALSGLAVALRVKALLPLAAGALLASTAIGLFLRYLVSLE